MAKPRKTDRPAGATYRVAVALGSAPADCTRVTHHGGSLENARQQARRMSKKYGTAYVIETVAGQNTAQLIYISGSVDGGTHNWVPC